MKRFKRLASLVWIVALLLSGCWVQGGLLTESTDADLVISWEREGGIIGFCDKVLVYADSTTVVSTCRLSDVPVTLTDEEAETVAAWRRAYSPVEVSEGDLAVADGLRETLQFYGTGDIAPNAAQLLVMEQFAIRLLARGTGTNP